MTVQDVARILTGIAAGVVYVWLLYRVVGVLTRGGGKD